MARGLNRRQAYCTMYRRFQSLKKDFARLGLHAEYRNWTLHTKWGAYYFHWIRASNGESAGLLSLSSPKCDANYRL